MRIFTLLSWLLAMGLPFTSKATHQVGGQLEMRAVGDVPGHYRIIVAQYLESGASADRQAGGTLGIFRKSDNVLMMRFTTRETGQRQPVIYANEFCAEQRNLKFIVATFEADIQLTPADYDDVQGYYISYQTRNRNGGINNIVNPIQTGYTFYLEFPALLQNSQLFPNSSPHFGSINGEYVCIGDPFTFPFGGTDPDGDELRYSMVTPLNQKGATGQNGGQNAVSPAPYPDVSWASGFGADNAIPGSPTLSIDAQTGQLSVTATQLGLFVFAVKVEEYRNGVKIGEVRRDFQFLVVDCPPQTTPDPAVQIKNRPKNPTTTICQGDSAILTAAANANWNYQWRRNDINISGATSSSLAVRESGQYTVIVSQKTTCSKAGNSEVLSINVIGSSASVSATGHLCATTGSIKITATGDPDVTYQWYQDNRVLTGQTTDSLRATQAGHYWAILTYTTLGCKVRTDTAILDRSPTVVATIKSSSGFNRICPQDSLPLLGSGGLSYRWQKDGTNVGNSGSKFVVKTAGIYSVTATDIYGCEGTSDPVAITQLAPISVSLDSIPGVCGIDGLAHILTGSPLGGQFAGTGVVGNIFSPRLAGVGDYAVTYTVKASPECAGVVATRLAVVAPIPTIKLVDSLTTYKGNTFSLNPVYTGNPTQFQWVSSRYLDNANVANPLITAIADDITYTLDVKNSTGCEVNDTIHIKVYARVWVPDAFSPNGDGLNDVWELPGIEAFPDAIVTVFNRWGEVIYSSGKGYTNPFDGTLNGTSLPSGVYAYSLDTIPKKPPIRGQLVLIR
ncbi:gliding motility-associated C-terminal domain-containing protein [Spirosoma flavum]|uniref:Gliding motility-associated C-terminal domain-containing protein n=1 Tax=Spirosoma flavum TaxID=2048557 RepID=A0ABW6AFB5_9BACT